MTIFVNIIGAGRLGKTIGHLLVKHQLVTIQFICNSSKTSSINAIEFIGQGTYCPTIGDLAPADITLITTPDDMISATCDELSKNQFIKKGSLFLHCSGSLTSDVLISVKEKGGYVASVHPMRSFANPELSVQQYSGTYCAVEGDKEAISDICSLFNSIGSITYEIDKVKKSSYHASGIFASNYLVTLAHHALLCMKEAGVKYQIAMQVVINIMKGTISNLETTLSPELSLTGPIQRGDISTIMKHIESLTESEQKYLYTALGKATLHLTAHDEETKSRITTVLAGE